MDQCRCITQHHPAVAYPAAACSPARQRRRHSQREVLHKASHFWEDVVDLEGAPDALVVAGNAEALEDVLLALVLRDQLRGGVGWGGRDIRSVCHASSEAVVACMASHHSSWRCTGDLHATVWHGTVCVQLFPTHWGIMCWGWDGAVEWKCIVLLRGTSTWPTCPVLCACWRFCFCCFCCRRCDDHNQCAVASAMKNTAQVHTSRRTRTGTADILPLVLTMRSSKMSPPLNAGNFLSFCCSCVCSCSSVCIKYRMRFWYVLRLIRSFDGVHGIYAGLFL
jgi:hypothetical protein